MTSGSNKGRGTRSGGSAEPGLGSDFLDHPPEKTDRQEVPDVSSSAVESYDEYGEGTDADGEVSQPTNFADLAAQVADLQLDDPLANVQTQLPPGPFTPEPAPPPVRGASASGSASKGSASGDDPWIGRMLANRYAVERVIAAGGMGRVYLATQMPLGRPVAIKVVRTEIQGSRQQFLRRFFLEASACAKLTHPNIITIHDYGEAEDGNVFMAMEYLDGRSLDKEIKDTAPMPPDRALHIAIQVSRALREAHAKGIIHRDLKPQNVMLMEQGDERDFVKVLDFGLVKMLSAEEEKQEAELTRAGVLLGSPNYMSPEQILGGALDHRTDIYSLGVVLFKMLAGKNPFTRDSETDVIYKHVYHPAPSIASLGVNVPPVVEALVAKCLAKKAQDRFADCKELVIAFKDARREVLGQSPKKKKKKREEPAPEASQMEPSPPAVIIPPAPADLPPLPPEEPAPPPIGLSQDLPPLAKEPKPEPQIMPSVPPPPRLASVPPRALGGTGGFRLADGSVAAGIPTRLYLRSNQGDLIGPLPLGQVEILFYARILDENTPFSSDAASFEPISSHPKLLEHLSAYRQAITDGGRPWEAQRSSIPPELAPRSMLDAFFRCAKERATGYLVAPRATGELRISFLEGKITEIFTDIPTISLAKFLIDKGLFSQAALDDRLPVPPTRSGDLGDALIAAGLVPPHVFLERVVEWAKFVLGAALKWDTTGLGFEMASIGAAQIPLAFERFPILAEIVRSGLDRDLFEKQLEPKANFVIIPSSPDGISFDDFKLKPGELRLLRSVDGSKTFSELTTSSNREQKDLFAKMLYFALEAGFFVWGEDTVLPKEIAEAGRLKTVLEQMREKPPLEAMNLSEKSTDEQVRGRYMELCKLYHPDNVRANAAPQLIEVMRALFTTVQEFYEQIDTAEKRGKFSTMKQLGFSGRENEEEVVRRILEAEVLFKKAKTFVKLSKYDEALAAIRDAVVKKPKDVEIKIHAKYYEYLAAARDKSGKTAEAEKAITEIANILKNEEDEIASGFLILGKLFKVVNKEAEAKKMFTKVLKFDPKNHEAESELRLMNLREQKQAKDKKGILGGLQGLSGLVGGGSKEK
ncbi:MAG: protein kinase [Myxococcota bacterium]